MQKKILLVNEVPEDSVTFLKGIENSEYTLLSELDSFSKVFLDFHQNPVAVIYNIKGSFADHEKFFAEKKLRSPVATVVFVNSITTQEIEQAIKSDIHSLIVNGLKVERIPAIIDTAIYRFEEQQKKENELLQTKRNLDDRKIIERAKGVLMDSRGMKENEAYKSLRKLAMDQNKKMVEVCNDVIQMFKYIS